MRLEAAEIVIRNLLDNYYFDDALFLSECLFAEFQSDAALHLLATSYYRAGHVQSAYILFGKYGSRGSKSVLLHARCCIDLKKPAEAESILMSSGEIVDVDSATFQPFVALSKMSSVLQSRFMQAISKSMLGKIHAKSMHQKEAVLAFRDSLTHNPFMWSSFSHCCWLGATGEKSGTQPVRAGTVFKRLPDDFCCRDQQCCGAVDKEQQPMPMGNGDPVVVSMENPTTNSALTVKMNDSSSVCSRQPSARSVHFVTPADVGSLKAMSAASPLDILAWSSSRNDVTCGSSFNLPPPGASGLTPFTPGVCKLPVDTPSCGSTAVTEADHCESIPGMQTIESTGVIVLDVIPASPGDFVVASTTPSVSDMIDKKVLPPKVPKKQSLSRKTQNTVQLMQFSTGSSSATRNASFSVRGGSGTANPHQVLTLNQSQIITRRSTRLSQASVKENNNKILNKPGRNRVDTSSDLIISSQNEKESPTLRKSTRIRRSTVAELNEKNLYEVDEKRNRSKIIANKIAERATKEVSTSTCFSSEDKSLDILLRYARVFGEMESAMSQFDCAGVIRIAEHTLTDRQLNMGWVLTTVARAHFEQGNYEKAIELFEKCRQQCPHYLKGIEYFGSALWQLQKDVELSSLATELTDHYRDTPQAWITAGNCFSLQKEHETAIRFFKRAIQLCPEFVYAYSLLGQEYIAVQEFDQAMQCFQTALHLQPRHYNSMYGIGSIYHKQGKLRLADFYYRQALAVNPKNSVLMCHISVVQQALQEPTKAMNMLERALVVAPRDPLCRFHRANLLFSQERLDDALNELEKLKQMVPHESQVYFLAGKVHKKRKENHLALMNFTWATDLDPRGGASRSYATGGYDEEGVTALATMDSDDAIAGAGTSQDLDDSL